MKTYIWPTHMDKLSRDSLTEHLTDLIDQNDRIGTITSLDALHKQQGKVEGYRYLLALLQSNK